MTQEDKELLLKDLCARLPYGVKVRLTYDKNTVKVREMGLGSLHDIMYDNAEGMPYLRPMSSMTEEEENEFFQINFTGSDSDIYGKLLNVPYADEVISWLNSHCFDFRGLIPMGLALEAPEDMYKIK